MYQRPGESLGKFREAHQDADTDTEPSSIHHTLGKGPNQAAPGNHTHPAGAHTHTDYSLTTHNHNGSYASPTHNHDSAYAPVGHTHSSSSVVMPYYHRGMANALSTTNGTVEVVNFETDVASDAVAGLTWNSVNRKFMCDVAGIYMISAAVAWPGVTSGLRYLYIMKNAGQIARVGGPIATGGTYSMAISDIVKLAVNDDFDIRVYQNQGNVSIPGSTSANYIRVTRIS